MAHVAPLGGLPHILDRGIEELDEAEIEALGLAEPPDYATWSVLLAEGK